MSKLENDLAELVDLSPAQLRRSGTASTGLPLRLFRQPSSGG